MLSLVVFAVVNTMAAFHAYKFTHFASGATGKTKAPEQLSFADKLKALMFGVDNPRPANLVEPTPPYQTVTIYRGKKTECWYVQPDQHKEKGTVILCHGYSGCKSMMLERSAILTEMGYKTFLMDFMGSGGSEGNQTTIGFKEAEQVKAAYDYVVRTGEKNVYLLGTSMGAAAILKSIHDYKLKPDAIILECPFGSMYQTTCARFRLMNIPSFPMAGLLVFWGGAENGFWAFGHNPSQYARAVTCPTLLLYGAQDKNVSRAETDEIFDNLSGEKTLTIYERAGHESYLKQYKEAWTQDLLSFLSQH